MKGIILALCIVTSVAKAEQQSEVGKAAATDYGQMIMKAVVANEIVTVCLKKSAYVESALKLTVMNMKAKQFIRSQKDIYIDVAVNSKRMVNEMLEDMVNPQSFYPICQAGSKHLIELNNDPDFKKHMSKLEK